jgi:hypothetical protein
LLPLENGCGDALIGFEYVKQFWGPHPTLYEGEKRNGISGKTPAQSVERRNV